MSMISDLTGSLDVATPDAPAPASESRQKSLLVVRAIANGQIPGAYVPADATPGTAGEIIPEELAESGAAVYRPTETPEVLAVIFDPGSVNAKEMKYLDSQGKLTETFPSVVSLLAGSSGAPATPVGPSGGPETQMPATVPIQPAVPPMGAAGQASLAAKRMESLNGVPPSERPLPARGSVLNGLATRAY